MVLLLLSCAGNDDDPAPTDPDADADADADADSDADADTDADVDPWEIPLDTATPGFAIHIVEVLADPTVDANCDGVVDAGDPFVEIVNIGTVDVDLGGATVEHIGGMRKLFPLDTVVPPGGAVVVFDGGDPRFGPDSPGSGSWCGALPPDVLVTLADRPMELPTCGEFRLDLAGPVGFWLDLFRAERLDCPGGQSLVRDPETGRDAPIVWHGALGPAPVSPGTRADGTAFGG